MGSRVNTWIFSANIVIPIFTFFTILFFLLLLVLPFIDSETELKARYQNDVIDCHPHKGKPPISYKEWKKSQ